MSEQGVGGASIHWRARRARIAENALSLYMRRPWTSVSLEEIGKEAGASFWKTYHAFDGPEDVYRAAVGILLDRIEREIATPPPCEKTVLRSIERYVSFLSAVFSGNDYRKLSYIRVRDEPIEHWLGLKYQARIVGPIVAEFRRRIEKAGQAQGISIDFDEKVCREAVAFLATSLTLPRILSDFSLSEPRQQQLIAATARDIWKATYSTEFAVEVMA